MSTIKRPHLPINIVERIISFIDDEDVLRELLENPSIQSIVANFKIPIYIIQDADNSSSLTQHRGSIDNFIEICQLYNFVPDLIECNLKNLKKLYDLQIINLKNSCFEIEFEYDDLVVDLEIILNNLRVSKFFRISNEFSSYYKIEVHLNNSILEDNFNNENNDYLKDHYLFLLTLLNSRRSKQTKKLNSIPKVYITSINIADFFDYENKKFPTTVKELKLVISNGMNDNLEFGYLTNLKKLVLTEGWYNRHQGWMPFPPNPSSLTSLSQITFPETLVELELFNADISDFDDLGQLQHLKILKIMDCFKIFTINGACLPETLKSLTINSAFYFSGRSDEIMERFWNALDDALEFDTNRIEVDNIGVLNLFKNDILPPNLTHLEIQNLPNHNLTIGNELNSLKNVIIENTWNIDLPPIIKNAGSKLESMSLKGQNAIDFREVKLPSTIQKFTTSMEILTYDGEVQFGDLINLKELNLLGNEEGTKFEFPPNLISLRILDSDEIKYFDTRLTDNLNNFKFLKVLELDYTYSSVQIFEIELPTSLLELKILDYCENKIKVKISNLSELNQLDQLYVINVHLQNSANELPSSIKTLYLVATKGKPVFKGNIKHLTKLKDLDLCHYRIKSFDFSKISPTMKTIRIQDCTMNEIMGDFKNLIYLSSLRLSKSRITNNILKKLEFPPSLKWLDLDENPILDLALVNLKSCSLLRHLSLRKLIAKTRNQIINDDILMKDIKEYCPNMWLASCSYGVKSRDVFVFFGG
ncbi:hypothetical protein KGF54_000073 [Candida jiufengensis]|uniref:uncharacterized protein n=1 Tax=Candida jiufengensis TaxID=497108 RepID=UPI0022241402|nr:uncharacterized protein KGF54_000073 [Candida jiufengensis]KAI5957145.1 hypothetical protein KGF54_000073 [Candida jiufengensis]